MKKTLVILAAVIVSSCASTSSIKTYNTNNAESACKTPIYVSTVAKTATELGNDLSYYSLTKWAQTNFGGDVSVQNIVWQNKGKLHVNVVFDVIRCNPHVEEK